MENQDQRAAVSNIVRILRKATRIVQLAPFAHLSFYVAYMTLGGFMPDSLVCLADSALTISPVITCLLLAASHLFKLCAWHKTACLIPMASQVEGYIDSYVVTFTQEEVLTINITLGLAALCFLALSIRHFAYGR